MKRLWMSAVMGMCALSLVAQAPNRTLRPQQESVQVVVPSVEKRIALVIGNAGYKGAPLKNPVNDARAMAEALGKSGFAVTKLEDATRAQMREAIRTFGARIAEGGVGLFYFAGHGMQVKGRNYLVPTGADIATEDEVAGEAVEVDAILAKMETARNRLNILILDACRNNPFGRSFRSTQQGLAQVDAPTGTFVAFATAPGRTAADGSGANGLYTEALLRQFRTPGLKLEEVFKRTRADVLRSSGQQQTPWENSSIVGDFYFVDGLAPSVSTANSNPSVVIARPEPVASGKRAPTPTLAEAKLLDDIRAERDGSVPAFTKLAGPLAAKGSIYGQFALGWMSKKEGVYYRSITQGSKQGIPLAMVFLAEFLVDSAVSTEDPMEARRWLDKAIELGEPQAKFSLGKLLMKGKLGPRDVPAAERLFGEATREFMPYCTLIGKFYLWESEIGITREEADSKAVAYFQRAANLGDAEAMERLGAFYAPVDFGKAVEWYTQGTAYGHVGCMYELGNLYQRAEDPNHRNGEKALKWYRLAAERGDLIAVENMADMYRDGEGIPKDLPQALALYQRAADKGWVHSQKCLGEMYEKGLGVPKSLAQAYFWFFRATSGIGGDKVVPDRDRLAALLLPAERARVEAQAKKLKPKNDD